MDEIMSIGRIYGALLYIAHTLFTFIQIIADLCAYIKTTLCQSCHEVSRGGSEFECISEKVRTLDKIPRHLVVVLGLETPSYKDLANLAVWSIASGIPFVSFYDHNGLLKKTENQLFEAIAERSGVKYNGGDWIKGDVSHSNGHRKNGVTPRKIRVSVFSLLDGHRSMAELTKECVNSVESSEVDVDLVDKCIRRRIGGLPDPDLAVLCGPTCTTYGLLPWQVRVTEFVNIKTHYNISPETFLSTLQFYGYCEQRYGK